METKKQKILKLEKEVSRLRDETLKDIYSNALEEIKELCNDANKTGRKTYLTYDILDIIQKVKGE